MDDFLHNLRTGKDKRYDRGRRGYEPSQYRSMDRQNGMDRRKKGNFRQQSSEQAYTTITKVLPAIKTLLETMAEDQKKRMKLEARHTIAMETIAVYLKKLSGFEGDLNSFEEIEEESQETQDMPVSAEADADEEVSEDMGETIQIIKRMREEQGLSFQKIAAQLETEGIPTPSGRGKWRGPAVSKLYKG